MLLSAVGACGIVRSNRCGREFMISVSAIYEKGVLRPSEPLKLSEGQTVQLSIYPQLPLTPLRPPTSEEEEFARRLQAAKTPAEMSAVFDSAPPEPAGYDLCRALDENRKQTGERLLYPELHHGEEQ